MEGNNHRSFLLGSLASLEVSATWWPGHCCAYVCELPTCGCSGAVWKVTFSEHNLKALFDEAYQQLSPDGGTPSCAFNGWVKSHHYDSPFHEFLKWCLSDQWGECEGTKGNTRRSVC